MLRALIEVLRHGLLPFMLKMGPGTMLWSIPIYLDVPAA